MHSLEIRVYVQTFKQVFSLYIYGKRSKLQLTGIRDSMYGGIVADGREPSKKVLNEIVQKTDFRARVFPNIVIIPESHPLLCGL